MCLSAWVYCGGKTKGSQLLHDIAHVVVEVTTYCYRSIGILPDDVSDDLSHPDSSLLDVLLFSRLEIAVKYLDVLIAELQLGPTEICPKCLHQLQSGVSSGRIPTPTTALLSGLKRPEPIKVE